MQIYETQQQQKLTNRSERTREARWKWDSLILEFLLTLYDEWIKNEEREREFFL